MVTHPADLDPTSFMRVGRIVMSEMDQPALIVPDVLAVHGHVVTRLDRGALPDGQVVIHQYRLRRPCEADDETLMHARRTAVVRENTRYGSISGDLDVRTSFRVVALDSRVIGARRCARGAEEQKECDDETAHDAWTACAPGTRSRRPSFCSTTATNLPGRLDRPHAVGG